MISTSTSPAFGPSRSTSWISSGALAATAIAARLFISASPNGSAAPYRSPRPPSKASLGVTARPSAEFAVELWGRGGGGRSGESGGAAQERRVPGGERPAGERRIGKGGQGSGG